MDSRTDPEFITQQLCQFVRANRAAGSADFDEHTLLAAVGIDSFALVELLLFCERSLGLKLPESLLTQENLASLSSLAHCLARRGQPVGVSPPTLP